MLKDLINNTGKSVYAVSKESGIAYTTLNELVLGKKKPEECSLKTILSLAKYFDMSIENLYSQIKETKPSVVINQTWLQKKRKKYSFPVIQASNYYDASRIHPLKQKLIYELANILTSDPRVDYSVLFGGSTTIRCNKNSDVDIAVSLKNDKINIENKNDISEKIQQLCNWNADIIWIDKVEPESKLAKSLSRGVVIK